MREMVEVFATYITSTDKAVLINDGGPENIWVPLSQLEDPPEDMDEGESYTFTMTEWLANQKGLI